jgi:hypothetical protein
LVVSSPGRAFIAAGVTAFVVIAFIALLGNKLLGSFAGADDPLGTVADRLMAEVVDNPESGTVVARVNGHEIQRRAIDVPLIFTNELPGSEGVSNVEEALRFEIDQALLVDAAREAGIVVTEAEVDHYIAASLQPFRDGTLRGGERRLMEVLMLAGGTTIEDAPENESYREAVRRRLVVGRFVTASGRDRVSLAEDLWESATIEILI